MAKVAKTSACRALDGLGIAYELRAYDVDPENLQATHVAAKLGLPAGQVFETLCLRVDDRSVLLAVLAGDDELDLKGAAKATGHRSLAPVAVRELPALTGYVRGGVTALAGRRSHPVVVDVAVLNWPFVSVSAGQRGLQILLAPQDDLRATAGHLAEIARRPR